MNRTNHDGAGGPAATTRTPSESAIAPGAPRRFRIEYRYRCLSGREYTGDVFLTNEHALGLPQLRSLLQILCYDGIYFDAVQCGLPSLLTNATDWHEIVGVGPADDSGTVSLDVLTFLTNALKQQRPLILTNQAAANPLVVG